MNIPFEFNLYSGGGEVTERIELSLSVPEGDRVDERTNYYEEACVRLDEQGEVIDHLTVGWCKGYAVEFQYTENDLNNNFIDLNEYRLGNPADISFNQYGDLIRPGYIDINISGTGFALHIVQQTYNSGVPGSDTILLSGSSQFKNNAWSKASDHRFYAGPPPQITNMLNNTNQPYYVEDYKYPRISFNIEYARHGQYEYPIMVVTGWYGKIVDGNFTYMPRWQRMMSMTLVTGSKQFLPKTKANTPNSTPRGGTGARNNNSSPMKSLSSDDLSGAGIAYSAYGSDGLHMYELDGIEWRKLTGKLWLRSWAEAVKNWWYNSGNLADCIVSACMIGLPLKIASLKRETGQPVPLMIGNMRPTGTAAITCYNLLTRFAETETYTVDIERYSETYLDFDPYTKIELHIPYCGVLRLSADDVVGGKVEVKYIVDLVDGACCAIVTTTDRFGSTKTVPVGGQAGIAVELVAKERNISTLANKLSASIGASQALTNSVGSGAQALLKGNLGGISNAAMSTAYSAPGYFGSMASLAKEFNHPSGKVEVLGSTGGSTSIMGDRLLYVAVYNPQDITGLEGSDINQIDQFGNKVGYPAASFDTIANFTGEYIEAVINPNSIQTATAAEKAAIQAMIQEGVYV